MQNRINAIGVTHRTIEEIRKRWYDLRSRTKEKVAERLKHARGTGGGPPEVPPPTPIETMVETTLEHEAVAGFGVIDSSAPTTSRGKCRLMLPTCTCTHRHAHT